LPVLFRGLISRAQIIEPESLPGSRAGAPSPGATSGLPRAASESGPISQSADARPASQRAAAPPKVFAAAQNGRGFRESFAPHAKLLPQQEAQVIASSHSEIGRPFFFPSGSEDVRMPTVGRAATALTEAAARHPRATGPRFNVAARGAARAFLGPVRSAAKPFAPARRAEQQPQHEVESQTQQYEPQTSRSG